MLLLWLTTGVLGSSVTEKPIDVAGWSAPAGYYFRKKQKPDKLQEQTVTVEQEAVREVVEAAAQSSYQISAAQVERMAGAFLRRNEATTSNIPDLRQQLSSIRLELARMIEAQEARAAIERMASNMAALLSLILAIQQQEDDDDTLLLLAA